MAHVESVRPGIIKRGQQMLQTVSTVLEAVYTVRHLFGDLEKTHGRNPAFLKIVNDARSEVTRLVPEAFIEIYSARHLVHLPRYMRAIGIRAQRAAISPEKNQLREGLVDDYVERLQQLLKDLTPLTSDEKRAAVEAFFWLLEEYKVSVFAQELKTAVPVSRERLDQALDRIERMC
jgi:ATP-dependent helicase HrpA